jgi:hypothetical protein
MSILDYCRPKTKAALLRNERVRWIENNSRAPYIRQCVLSFPPWVCRTRLREIWDECRRLEQLHGEPYHVSHIVPLNHPHVSGLSVPWNLVPKPRRVNLAEGDRWSPDQMCLFDAHEQLRLGF